MARNLEKTLFSTTLIFLLPIFFSDCHFWSRAQTQTPQTRGGRGTRARTTRASRSTAATDRRGQCGTRGQRGRGRATQGRASESEVVCSHNGRTAKNDESWPEGKGTRVAVPSDDGKTRPRSESFWLLISYFALSLLVSCIIIIIIIIIIPSN